MRLNKTQKISISLIVISSLTVWLVFSPHQKITKPELCIGNHCIDIAIADTPQQQEQWLMYIKYIPENSGMLFVFDKEDSYIFRMKNTLIPLDMIWINKDNKIVDIQEALPCITDICQTYPWKEPASYVLEINKWLSKKRGISIGEKVSISY